MSRKLARAIIFLLAAVMCAAFTPLRASAEKSGDYKLVALTFDDGPGRYTERLLDELKAREVKATFFMVGSNAARYPELLQRMADEGHQLGNHSYSHPFLSKLSAEKIKNELASCREYLAAAGGDDATYFVRPPYGAYNSRVKESAGAPLVTWSVDPRDWSVLNTEKVVSNVMDAVRDGDIILLHDIYSTSVDAAIIVVDKLLDEGYEFVTVSELLRRRGVEAEDGVVYSCARNNGVNLGPYVDPEAFDETLIKEHPAYQAIRYARFTGLFSGGEGDAFYPNKYLSRGMFVAVLGRFAGAEAQSTAAEYTDVAADAYYAPYAAWAAENGIMSGYGDGRFGPDDPMTREQFAVCLARYLDTLGLSEDDIADAGYADEGDIMTWAKTGVDRCSKLGLLTGGSDGYYNPHGFATRGQCAIVFERLAKYVDPEAYEASRAEMNGETVKEPEPEEPSLPAIATGESAAPASASSLAGISVSDGVIAVAGVTASAALLIEDRKKR